MAEQLSEAEFELLCDALNDGFPDMLGGRSPDNRKNQGAIFSTNPLGQEITYFMASEDAPLLFDLETLKEDLSSDGEVYDEVNFQREYFALNPFGYNLEKLKDFFDGRVAKNRPLLIQKYNEYFATVERYPLEFLVYEPEYPDVFDGVYSFEQWIENILVPYSKIWFEHQIAELIEKAGCKKTLLSQESLPPIPTWLAEYQSAKRMKAHFILGRMVEQYKWKFKYEDAIVRRQRQSELAGNGGGRSSNAKRTKRLEAFMQKIEELADLAELIDQERVLAQAWDNVSKAMPDMPKTPKIRFDYEVELRSTEPFRTRYMAIFYKSA